jgi:hypothetical protein
MLDKGRHDLGARFVLYAMSISRRHFAVRSVDRIHFGMKLSSGFCFISHGMNLATLKSLASVSLAAAGPFEFFY